MSVFKDHKISLKQVLEFIPEALLTHLSATTKVDYYSKVLHGKKMFYLLLFCIFDNEKLSQRTLEDTFNPNSAIEKKEYFSILISNCVAVEKNKR